MSKHIPTFIMLVGLPGSGKSTYACSILDNPEIAETFAYISTDAIVQERADALGLTYDDVWPEYIKEATAQAQATAAAAFKAGVSVIWDQTNLGVKKRRGVLAQVPKKYDTVVVVFEIDEELRQQRIANRPGKTIPFAIDRAMQSSFVHPSVDEGFDRVSFHRAPSGQVAA